MNEEITVVWNIVPSGTAKTLACTLIKEEAFGVKASKNGKTLSIPYTSMRYFYRTDPSAVKEKVEDE